MSSWRTSPDTSGPRAKCETVVFEAIAKAAEIIIHSRLPLPVPLKPSSSRFNLHVPEVEDVRYVVIVNLDDVELYYDCVSGRRLIRLWRKECFTFACVARAISQHVFISLFYATQSQVTALETLSSCSLTSRYIL